MEDIPPLRVYWHRETILHEPPDGAFKLPSTDLLAVDEPHPDQPARVKNIRRIIEETFVDRAHFIPVEPASRSRLEAVHTAEYLDWLESFCADGGGRIDGTTTGANDMTFVAARRAAGAALEATAHTLEDRRGIPYALCRPSGHHAQSDRADGFCFLNNAAVAAQYALETSCERVAIVDWDVHHGNGTQENFEERDDVLYISIHNDHGAWDPTYHPQTGGFEEDGVSKGKGFNVNIPIPSGTGDHGYELIFENLVEPIIESYNPDLIVYSAGQDPGISDPLGRNVVSRTGFRTLGERARTLADRTAGGRYVLVQEGGYQISHLAFATLGVLEGAIGSTFDLEAYGGDDPFAWLDEEIEPLEKAIEQARQYHAEYWPV
ncbi:arginase family protein [Natronorarus salvus]|uniref:class II histone deacetylase n=1 Tax=Natronorarus salvus TaxID=3117733 RepID=UPI002F2683A7